MLDGLSMVTFDPIRHEYTLVSTGERLLSVTQILKLAGLGADYSGIPPAILKHAAERGSYVDTVCNLFDEDDLDWDSVHPEARPYADAWVRFRVKEPYEPARSAVIVGHPPLGYAGTADSVGTWNGMHAIVDRKCTLKIDESYGVQLAGYALGGQVTKDGLGIATVGVEHRLIVQLKKDGTYDVLDCDKEMARTGRDDFACFKAALEVARWKTHARNGRP